MIHTWKHLTTMEQLNQIVLASHDHTVCIYKHSTTCPVNHDAMERLESGWNQVMESDPDLELYYLDLLAYRDVSNAVAAKFDIQHQSPQILVIQDGECVHDQSHWKITVNDLLKRL